MEGKRRKIGALGFLVLILLVALISPAYSEDQTSDSYICIGQDCSSSYVLTGIDGGNSVPVLDPVGDKTGDEGALLSFNITASDIDGDPVVFSAEPLPTGSDLNSSTGRFSWTPNFDQSGEYRINITVTDIGGLYDSEEIYLFINNTNRAPIIYPLSTQMGKEGDLIQFQLFAYDPDGDTLTFNAKFLPSGSTFDTINGIFSWTPGFDQNGTYQIHISASDGNLTSSEEIGIDIQNTNRAPILNTVENQTGEEDSLLKFLLIASDPDGEDLTFDAYGLPEGAYLNEATGLFTWTPDYNQSGEYNVTFTVSDIWNLSDSENIIIKINNTNRAPVIEPIGNKTVSEGSTLAFTVNASDPDEDQVMLEALNLPTGAKFNSSTGMFSWSPTFKQNGTFNVNFTANDGHLMVSENITLTVRNVNRYPVLNPIGNYSIAENQSLNFNLSGSDPDGDYLVYSAAPLPRGATLTSHVFNWTPDYSQNGNYSINFTVDDGELFDYEVVYITVTDIKMPPVLESIGNLTINEGLALSFMVNASDPDKDPLMYSSGSLPDRATFNTTTRIFSWIPSYSQAGTYNVNFSVKDTTGSIGWENVIITVVSPTENKNLAVNYAPIFDPITNQTAAETYRLVFTIHATDFDDSALIFSATQLPSGAYFDVPTKTFYWTPAYGSRGQYQAKFTVTDGSISDSMRVSINVTTQPLPPNAASSIG
jgi:hypothetical protein